MLGTHSGFRPSPCPPEDEARTLCPTTTLLPFLQLREAAGWVGGWGLPTVQEEKVNLGIPRSQGLLLLLGSGRQLGDPSEPQFSQLQNWYNHSFPKREPEGKTGKRSR